MAAAGESVLEPGWLLSPAGRPYLDSIFQKNQRRVFGLLDRPMLPPALAAPTVSYKLFLTGKSGVGKTALVATLAGTRVSPVHHETLGTSWGRGTSPPVSPGVNRCVCPPGIESTTIYWPAKVQAIGRPVIFRLDFWDCGDGVLKKFEHLLPACKEEADAILFLFSFTDRSSFEELPAQMGRTIGPDEGNLLRVVVGTKFDLSSQADVTEGDLMAFEGTWGLPVLRAGSTPRAKGGLEGVARVAPLLDALVERLWRRGQTAAGVTPEGEGSHPT
ncbi:ciliogenesis and planar polarity effector 2 isoform 1-T1 [Podargus strigoides]